MAILRSCINHANEQFRCCSSCNVLRRRSVQVYWPSCTWQYSRWSLRTLTWRVSREKQAEMRNWVCLCLGFTYHFDSYTNSYLVTEVYGNRLDGFLWQIILRAIIIGIGGWTGTILCTPTLLGINKGLMDHNKAVPTLVENGSMSDNMSTTSSVASGQHFRRRDKGIRKHGTGALLFF